MKSKNTLSITNNNEIHEGFHTLYTPFYSSKEERHNQLLENRYARQFRNLFRNFSNTDKQFTKTMTTLLSNKYHSPAFRKKILIEITTQSDLLNVNDKILNNDEEIFSHLLNEECSSEKIDGYKLGIVSDYHFYKHKNNLKNNSYTSNKKLQQLHFISKLADKYLFAITSRCSGIINFSGIPCRKVGVEKRDYEMWKLFMRGYDIELISYDKSKRELLEIMFKGVIDVFLYCDYFPNIFVSTLVISKDTLLIEFPHYNDGGVGNGGIFQENIFKGDVKENKVAPFIPKTLSINEGIDEPQKYNIYYTSPYWYKTYKFNEILISNVELPSHIGYKLAQIIYERLAMRDNDKLFPNEDTKIQIQPGALKFIENITNNMSLEDHEFQCYDDGCFPVAMK